MPFDRRPILVPLDGSHNAEAAAAPAFALARKLGAPVRFIHAIDPDVFEGQVDVEKARETFRGYAREMAERNRVGSVPYEIVVLSGHAAQGILDSSAAAQAVVIASHGRSGLHATLFGSVADKIVRGAKVPTLVIPLGCEIEPGSGPVLVGLDGSGTAEAGLATARELARVLGVKVALVRAFSIPPPVGVEFVAYPVDLGTSLREATEAYLKETAEPGEDVYAVMAPPVDAIDQAAEACNASVVVMTSHGKGFAQRIALGSVTDRAMHTLKRPLLVVPVTG
jgi:nucleotide-binding universal stress UspA family protein